MAHDIDESTGKPAIAYVGETPWHGLGEKLPERAPIEKWIEAARLNWEIDKFPVQYLVDGKLRTLEDRFVLARNDTGAALSIVSGDYQVVQPKELIEFYRDLVADYGYDIETAGALNGGRKVWALAKTGKIVDLAGEGKSSDRVDAYVLLATSCDKTLATTAAFTSIRVVCQNTLFFALDEIGKQKRRHISVPHTHRFVPKEVKEKLGLIDKAWSEFIGQARKMIAKAMASTDASSFFQGILSEKDGELSNKHQRQHETLMALFRSAPGQDVETAKGTLWGAVNAITYHADHVMRKTNHDRLDSAWFGAGNQLKEKAWEAAKALVS